MTKPKTVVTFPDQKLIESEAAEWLVRMEDGDATESQLAEFHAWCHKSSAHRNAFDRMAKLWGDFDIVEQLNDYAIAGDNIAALNQKSQSHTKTMNRRPVLAAIAATLLLATGIGLMFPELLNRNDFYKGNYQTAIGEQQTVELPDGSAIKLNTDTIIEVSYTKAARNIHLLQGEAYFNVASNKQRPFSVYAGNGVVTAVGTAFSVRMLKENVDVTVAEGRIAITAQAEKISSSIEAVKSSIPDKPLLEITAGESVSFDNNLKKEVKQINRMEMEELNRKLSWRDGIIAFAGEPLSQVITDVSRYTEINIEVDEKLRDLPIAGYFKVGEVDSMLEALQMMADLQVERLQHNQVRLSRKPE